MDVFVYATNASRVSVSFGVLGDGPGTLAGIQVNGTWKEWDNGGGGGTWTGTIAADGKSGNGTLSGKRKDDGHHGYFAADVTGAWTIYPDRGTRPCS